MAMPKTPKTMAASPIQVAPLEPPWPSLRQDLSARETSVWPRSSGNLGWIAWNRQHPLKGGVPGLVRVGPWPDTIGWSDGFDFAVGACSSHLHSKSEPERVAQLFQDFHTMVVRDGVDPLVAHDALLQIEEYRQHIATDIRGATVKEPDGTERPCTIYDQ